MTALRWLARRLVAWQARRRLHPDVVRLITWDLRCNRCPVRGHDEPCTARCAKRRRLERAVRL